MQFVKKVATVKVLKFGGSSVGSKESITNLKQIVESQQDDVIVVVSALGGITDKLIATAKMAAKGERQYEAETEAMLTRHEDMIRDVIVPERRRKAYNQVRKLFGELKEIMQGLYLLHDLSEKTMDTIVSYGERLSSQIVAQLIDDIKLYDSREFIKTEHNAHNHAISSDLTYKLEYIDKQDCLEGSNDVITRWHWHEKWLALESEFNLDELECSELSDIMYMIEG